MARRCAAEVGAPDHSRAIDLQKVWHELECVSSEPDPFVRLGKFYEIHDQNSMLSADCALGEGLGNTTDYQKALRRALVFNEGSLTQSALSCQTLHRLLQSIGAL